MSTTARSLVGGVLLSTTPTVYYTVPASTTTVIKRATFSNTSSSAKTITVNLVPGGSAIATANQIINARSLAAGETYVAPELTNQVLATTGMIYANADASGAVSMTISGVQIT